MDLSRIDYSQQIVLKAEKDLGNEFAFSKSAHSPFSIINALLCQHIFLAEETNLLITVPTKEQIKDILEMAVLFPVLKCFLSNGSVNKFVSIGDIIIQTDCGTISTVKAVNANQITILPIGTLNRVTLSIDSSFVILSHKIKERIIEILSRNTIERRQKGAERLKSDLRVEINQYKSIFNYIHDNSKFLPVKHKTKIIAIAPKNIVKSLIPSCIPYIYINKYGKIEDEISFEPILYVVNDFEVAKEFIIEKNIEIDTIIFIGDNKYKTTTSVSRLYRQAKFKRCIFIGTEDIETTDKFKILKWNWTLPETNHFFKATNSNINPIKLTNPELSNSIQDYIKIIDVAEQQNENLINLKKSLRYIRKIYPITALDSERIRSRANDIYEDFEKEIEEVFQDEYQGIDGNYKPNFEALKSQFGKIIGIIKNNNAKINWFKEQAKDVDYIIVPKIVKSKWVKELEKCLQNQYVETTMRSFAHLNTITPTKVESVQFYKGLKTTQVITLKEFEQKEADNKKYLFISLYGYGIFPETLLEKILSKNVVSEILLYDEEYNAFQYYLHKFHESVLQEFRSSDRAALTGIKYATTQSISTENIDDWIKNLIDADSFKFSKGAEIRYEITFEEDDKKIKEKESKNVYVEGYDEHHKEINELKKGDKVRVYQNPDIEILHDIIKMTDEKELFSNIDKFSALWKTSLIHHLNNKDSKCTLNELFEKLVANGLSVSKNQLENWIHPDNKTKFPKRKIDFSAIVKTVNNEELNNKWKFIMETNSEYLGTLNQKGRKFAEEIDNYILTGEKGDMLNWLSDNHIKRIVLDGAPLRTIKEIKKLDYEITD